MKKVFLFPLLAFIISQGVTAQVKLGDNPQSIDPASLFELESTDQVLVITRVTSAELQAITPSMGALAYNTDEKCLFYHNGDVWVNLCEALGRAFTTDAIQNEFPTMVITPLAESINFEVGEIRSENIVDFSIGSQDIQNNSINSEKLADASVGSAELQDNAVTSRNLDFVDITLSDFINDVPFLVEGSLVAAAIQYDNTSSGLGALELQAAIDILSTGLGSILLQSNGDGTYIFTNSEGIPTDLDFNASALPFDNTSNGFAANNVQEAIEEIQGGSTDDQTLTLMSPNLEIEDGNSVNLSEFLDNTDAQNLTLEGAVLGIENGNTVNLSGLRQDLADVLSLGSDAGGTRINNLLDPDNPQDAATRKFVEDRIDELVISGGGDAPNEFNEAFEVVGNRLVIRDARTNWSVGLDEIDTNTTNTTFAQDGTSLIITDSDGNNVSIPLDDLAAAIDSNTTNTSLTQDGTDLILTDSDGNNVSIPLDDLVAAINTNTTNTDLAQDGTNLILTDSDGNNVSIPLDDLAAEIDSNTTNTSLTQDGTDLILTDSDGNDVTISLEELATLLNTDSQSATDVPIIDSNDNFTSTNVEGALEELISIIGNVAQPNQSAVSVWGKIVDASTIKGNGISSIENLSVGLYRVVFTTPFSDSDYTVQLTVFGNNRIYMLAQEESSFEIEIRNNTDELANSNFFVSIIE